MSQQTSTASSVSKRRRRRNHSFTEVPEVLLNAAEFSDDADLGDPIWLLQTITQHPDIVADLDASTDFSKHYGRDRLPGKWWMIMLAFVCSGEVDVQTFWKRWRSTTIWQIAGFPSAPGHTTCWERLTELEPHAALFTEAANKLIRRAVGHEPRISRWIWTDGTGFETHAVTEHCCPDKAACKAARAKEGKKGPPPRYLPSAGNEFIKNQRHAESKTEPGGIEIEPVVETDSPGAGDDGRRRRAHRYFWIGAPGKRHRYRTLDPDAGVRTYSKAKSRTWLGGNCCTAVSMFVGVPLAIDALCPANVSEAARWPALLDSVTDATGDDPEAVVMDRHYSIGPVFEHNTTRGIASVIPWRKWGPKMKYRSQTDTDRWDRHGVVRCTSCGGPCDQTASGLGLYFARGKPRLRVKCMLGLEPGCKRLQSIACEEEWRLLTPISRLSTTYHALGNTGKSYERVFRHWRDRYTVAGNDIDTRPKRAGLAWQHLRAQTALLIEWYFLSLRHGWLGSHRRRNQSPVLPMKPGKQLTRLQNTRRMAGLNVPTGKYAIEAGYGDGLPPPDATDDVLPF